MATNTSRGGWRALALCTTSLALLVLSAFVTTIGYFAWHVLSTRPNHCFSFFFEHKPGINGARGFLEADIPFAEEHGLRSVADLQASVRFSLPESDANIQNSVFQISAELYGEGDIDNEGQEVCLTRGSRQASLQFRSPIHRAIRVIVLWIPLLLGWISEYQVFEMPILHYNAKASVHDVAIALSGIRVRVLSEHVQIADALLKVHVVRSSFVRMMIQEGRVSTFLMVAIGLWYVMLLGLVASIALVGATRMIVLRAVVGLSGSVYGKEEETEVGERQVDSSRPEAYTALASVPVEEGSSVSTGLFSRFASTESMGSGCMTYGWGGSRNLDTSSARKRK